MKVLYDISALGIGYANSDRRTGVFRVAENIALELIKMPECDISFCSYYSMDAVHQSIAYQKTIPAFKNVPFPRLENSFFKKKKYRYRMATLADKLQSGKPVSFAEKLFTKIKIQQAGFIQKFYTYGDKKLISVADLNQTDIYHSPFFSVTNEIKKTHVKKVFATCYDLIPIFKPEYCNQESIIVMKEFLESIDRETWVPCISGFTRNELLMYMGARVDPTKVIVTELAASQSFYKSIDSQKNNLVRAHYGIPEGPFILSVCTLEPRKNIETVIQAFKHLVQQQHLHDLSLVLVGNKGLKSAQLLLELDTFPEIKKKIIITGFVPDEDLAALYSDAMMFVYPSFYEGFGLPPLEAMQCGVPVITSNTTSLPEVVGDAGIMIAPTDLDALCQAMLSIYKSPSLQQQMAQQSLKRAKQFSWKRCADETVAAYKASL